MSLHFFPPRACSSLTESDRRLTWWILVGKKWLYIHVYIVDLWSGEEIHESGGKSRHPPRYIPSQAASLRSPGSTCYRFVTTVTSGERRGLLKSRSGRNRSRQLDASCLIELYKEDDHVGATCLIGSAYTRPCMCVSSKLAQPSLHKSSNNHFVLAAEHIYTVVHMCKTRIHTQKKRQPKVFVCQVCWESCRVRNSARRQLIAGSRRGLSVTQPSP